MQLEDLFQKGRRGSEYFLAMAEDTLGKVRALKGEDQKVSFPATNYFLPLSNALLQREVRTLRDCYSVVSDVRRLTKGMPASNGFLLRSHDGALDRGIAALLCAEILGCLKYADGGYPCKGDTGFLPDSMLRSIGIQLVDGRMAGAAIILGPAKNEDSAAGLANDFQRKSIVSMLAGAAGGKTFKEQLTRRNFFTGLEDYIISLGGDYISPIYAINWAIRVSLIYGGFKGGQWNEILRYTREKVPAFIVLLSTVDECVAAVCLGALALGFPIVSDLDLFPLGKIDTTVFGALVVEKDYKKISTRGAELKGLKIRITGVPVPLPYSSAFEGERVREGRLYAEFGGSSGCAFEYLTAIDTRDVEDGKIELAGSGMDIIKKSGTSLPLGIMVEVAGRKMQKDFESILQRQIQRFVNYAAGLAYSGRRDKICLRVSRDACAGGFRLKHIGVILHAMLHQEFNAIVDKVQVKLYTGEEDVRRLLETVRVRYNERDKRMNSLCDENADTFYSCTLCQSLAPNHVCIITPERPGMCGAYSWLEGKAGYEINPTGPNRPIVKGKAEDISLGQWANINDFVFRHSNKSIDKVSLYSIMEQPLSSCGCFECIAAIVPEAHGVMVVDRDYGGMTPSGMSFSSLADLTGSGVQNPGFMGIGKMYIVSRKFISAEGGIKRLVWMPRSLKEEIGGILQQRLCERGDPEFFDKIADEASATTPEELLDFLRKVKHPVLEMKPLV